MEQAQTGKPSFDAHISKAVGNMFLSRRQQGSLNNKHMEGSLTGKAYTMPIPTAGTKQPDTQRSDQQRNEGCKFP